jgi:SAM-dependent methyltransferase
MGDLLPFLYAKGKNFKYLGIDITPEFIEIARKRFEGHDFEVGDPFAENLGEKFDIVVSSGVMNANPDDWLNKRKAMITQLFSHSRKVLAFNMAGGLAEPSEVANIGYANSQEIFDFCTTLTKKIILRNHYHSKDFTIVMFRQSASE